MAQRKDQRTLECWPAALTLRFAPAVANHNRTAQQKLTQTAFRRQCSKIACFQPFLTKDLTRKTKAAEASCCSHYRLGFPTNTSKTQWHSTGNDNLTCLHNKDMRCATAACKTPQKTVYTTRLLVLDKKIKGESSRKPVICQPSLFELDFRRCFR